MKNECWQSSTNDEDMCLIDSATIHIILKSNKFSHTS